MRIGRGAWVAGGGGVLAAAIVSSLLYAMLLVSGWVLITAIGLLVAVTAYVLRRTKSARRAQLAMPLMGCLDDSAVSALDGRAKVWAVYAVGDQFHYGIDPKKGEDLLRLYSDREAQIARVARFPDAGRARSAAGQLQRQGYSFAELLRLFPRHFTPGRGLDRQPPPTPLPVAPGASEVAPGVAEGGSGVVNQGSNAGLQPLVPRPARSAELKVINTGANQVSMRKDTTQYTFEDETTGKGRLVLAIVKRYVREHQRVMFQDVRAAFPDELQADSPIQFSKQNCVVARLDDLPSAAHKRFHVGEGDFIELSDGPIVVSREWNRFNIQNVLRRAQELGYAVAVVPSAQ